MTPVLHSCAFTWCQLNAARFLHQSFLCAGDEKEGRPGLLAYAAEELE